MALEESPIDRKVSLKVEVILKKIKAVVKEKPQSRAHERFPFDTDRLYVKSEQ